MVAVALVAIPVNAIHWYWWVPLIVDLGRLPVLFMTAGFFVREAISRRTK